MHNRLHFKAYNYLLGAKVVFNLVI